MAAQSTLTNNVQLQNTKEHISYIAIGVVHKYFNCTLLIIFDKTSRSSHAVGPPETMLETNILASWTHSKKATL
jgi:hypothetical protein